MEGDHPERDRTTAVGNQSGDEIANNAAALPPEFTEGEDRNVTTALDCCNPAAELSG